MHFQLTNSENFSEKGDDQGVEVENNIPLALINE
jgi:hypothetical protein